MTGASPRESSSRSKELGVGHEPPGNGAHLLFPAREGSRLLVFPFVENGEKLVDPEEVFLDTLRILPGVGAHEDVFLDPHPVEEFPPFRNQGDSERDSLVRTQR